MAKYGMPYQGSKQAIADELIKQFPKADHFYDLFGGGGSITHAMVVNRGQDYQTFHYNEIDPLIVRLFQAAVAGEFNYDKFKPKWVPRERFFEKKDSSGYVRAIWSFGNAAKTYLYGKQIEPYKRSMHMAIVFDEFDTLASEVLGFAVWPPEVRGVRAKRLFLRRKIDQYRKTNTLPECLISFLSEKQQQEWAIIRGSHQLRQLQQLQQLQQLERLQQLEQLQQLQQLELLNVSSASYDTVSILPNSAIYCDIPYLGTEGYSSEFSRTDFLNWADKQQVPVYISEYNIDDPRFKEVWQIPKRKGMQRGSNDQKAIEKLYVNKAGQNG